MSREKREIKFRAWYDQSQTWVYFHLGQTMTNVGRAIDPRDGELKTWIGPRIEAISWGEAREKIRPFGYLIISGVLQSEECVKTGKKKKLANWN